VEELESTTLFDVDDTPKIQNSLIVKKDRGVSVGVVDPFSTGAIIASLLYDQGYKVVAIYSANLEQLGNLQNLVPLGLKLTFESVLGFSNVEDMLKSLKALAAPMVAILAGAETGVELADQLSERMGLVTNGTALSEARRNKFVMGETIRAAGIRAVKQLRATTWGEIDVWIKEWNPLPFKVIVKPMDSAGSDDVTLCQSYTDVQNAFGNIMGKVNGLGLVNKAVLVQEYLEGQEYVVDMVSREGEHKVAAIWAYDRRPANGAHFVCFGQRLLTADDPLCPELVAYMKKVVTALGIRYVHMCLHVCTYGGRSVHVSTCVCAVSSDCMNRWTVTVMYYCVMMILCCAQHRISNATVNNID
jgi:biotin carboxylase